MVLMNRSRFVSTIFLRPLKFMEKFKLFNHKCDEESE